MVPATQKKRERQETSQGADVKQERKDSSESRENKWQPMMGDRNYTQHDVSNFSLLKSLIVYYGVTFCNTMLLVGTAIILFTICDHG